MLHNRLALLLGDYVHNAVNVPAATHPIKPTMPLQFHRTFRKRVFRKSPKCPRSLIFRFIAQLLKLPARRWLELNLVSQEKSLLRGSQ